MAGFRRNPQAYDVNDYLCSATFNALDRATEDLWVSKSRQNQALRKLSRDVAADWVWATGSALPELKLRKAMPKLWRHGSEECAHPLWVILDAVGFDVGLEAANAAVEYALGRDLPLPYSDMEERRAKLLKKLAS